MLLLEFSEKNRFLHLVSGFWHLKVEARGKCRGKPLLGLKPDAPLTFGQFDICCSQHTAEFTIDIDNG